MTTNSQSDREAAAALAEAVDNLPLALEQAAAYVRQTGISLADYLKLFREHEEASTPDAPDTAQYPKALSTTWSVTFQRIKEEFPASADLLTLCAFLAPDDIPLETLAEGAEHLPESFAATAGDMEALSRAAATLQDYSLAKVRGGSFLSLHRFVQSITRDHLTEDTAKIWAEAAVGLVNKAFPPTSNDVRTWPVCSKLLPHSLAVVDHAKGLRVVSKPLGRLLNEAGVYLAARAESDEAKKLYEQAIVVIEETYGVEHPALATILNNLGELLRKQGDLSGAKVNNERALKIAETARGPEDRLVAVCLNNLGAVLKDQGDLEEALTYYQRALAINEAEYGANHPDVAIRLNNIAMVLYDKGDLADARSHIERALRIDEAEYGANHPDVAIDLNNLASVLKKQGDLNGARDHFKRALYIFRKFLGEDHPLTLLARNNLALLEKRDA